MEALGLRLRPASTSLRRLRILGCRGVPAEHGGFETFAERLSTFLAQRGWQVTVYCQERGVGAICEDSWREVRRVHIPVRQDGPIGTVVFDWRSTRHAARGSGLTLTLGYNTAALAVLLPRARTFHVMNMDGIEWKRKKWKRWQRIWLYANERIGCWLADRLIADNPGIAAHLSTRASRDKIEMIPYGADAVRDASSAPLQRFGLVSRGYALVVARLEPDNSILEIVSAFSQRRRGLQLAVVGPLNPVESGLPPPPRYRSLRGGLFSR